MEVTIGTGTGLLKLDASVVDVGLFLANVLGYDLDLEPTGNGYSSSAVHRVSGAHLVANGRTMEISLEKLVTAFTAAHGAK